VDLLFPKTCGHCGDPFRSGLSNILCGSCFDAIQPYEGIRCARCGVSLPEGGFADSARPRCRDCGEGNSFLGETFSFGDYSGALRLAHHAFKFEGMPSLGKRLAAKMAQGIPGSFWTDVETLVPVPLSAERERERGYHPARILAQALAKRIGKPSRDYLTKPISNPAQMSLSREKRLGNPKGAYCYAGPFPSPGRVVLVDDVLTTGATLEECAKVLYKAGVAHIQAVVYGRTPRNFKESAG
ncbi:MAG: double zinc ribbon domain-containing protein, partial [bacterium]